MPWVFHDKGFNGKYISSRVSNRRLGEFVAVLEDFIYQKATML